MVNISVVIPVYGVEKYIDQLLDSIRKQKLEDIEIIFVDDGSPDRCPEILDEFVKENSNRYKVIHQKNGGVSAARNAGIAVATGKYLYIADSDDWLADNALELLWNEASRTDADMVYGDWFSVKGDKEEYIASFPNAFVTTNKDTLAWLQCACNSDRRMFYSCPEFEYINHLGGAPWRYLVKHAIIADNNLKFDSSVKGLGDDILFALHLYEYVNKVAYIQEPIYHYRMVEMSYSHGYKKNLLEVYSLIFERMEDFLSKNNKNERHWNAYYFRVWIYLQQAMQRFFLNEQNPDSEQQRYKEFCSIIQKEPYCTVISKLPIKYINGKRERLSLVFLRMRQYKLFWKLKIKQFF